MREANSSAKAADATAAAVTSKRYKKQSTTGHGRHVDIGISPPPDDRVIREPECERRSGLSRSTRWRLERMGQFPRRRRISPGCSGWLASEIDAWLCARAKAA